MKTLLTAVLVIAANFVFACTCSSYWSFCTAANQSSNNPVIAGKIMISDSTSISVLVIEKLRGSISDTITIKDQETNSCVYPEMAFANRMGNVGDTIIAILSLTNDGKYIRQESSCGVGDLLISNGFCTDYIVNTVSNFPSPNDFTTYSYSSIINNWKTNSGDCRSLVGLEKNSIASGITFTNNSEGTFRIQSVYSADLTVNVYNLSGKLIKQQSFSQITTVNLNDESKGIYLFQITNKGIPILNKKLLK